MAKFTKGHFEHIANGILEARLTKRITEAEADLMVDVMVPILRNGSSLTVNGNKSFKEDVFREWAKFTPAERAARK